LHKVVQELDRLVSPGFLRFLAIVVIGVCLAVLVVWVTYEPSDVAMKRMQQ
jgi:hypothetical protein